MNRLRIAAKPAVSPVAVYAIIYSDKADIITRKDNIRILSNSQIVTTKAAEVFDQPAAHKPLLDKLKAFLHTGTIEVRPLYRHPPEFFRFVYPWSRAYRVKYSL